MSKLESVMLGAGCFWGVESIFSELEGVISTEVGYSGGQTENPSYEDVCTGTTGHAEVVKVLYDTRLLSLKDLLNVFWRLHDPTQLNRQGADSGTQYRSAIFFEQVEQQILAIQSKEEFQNSGVFDAPVVTEILPAKKFYRAEEYHQNYFKKNNQAVCHLLRNR